MVNDRQQVTDDLARLTQQMRTAARELAPTQPAASGKLRSALEGMDENDLGTRMQRSSDWLRSGNFSDPARNRPHQRPAKAGSAGRRRGSRLGQCSAHFRGRRAQPGHGRSIPSARPTRRPRRTSQLSTWTGSARPWPANPAGQQFQPGQLNAQRGNPASRQRSARATGPAGKAVKTASRRQQAVKPAEARRVRSATASPVRWAIRPVARPIAIATGMAATTPAILASPAGPWRPNKVPTRPIPSARSTRD